MIDINFILNGNKKPTKKKSRDPLRDLMIGPRTTSVIGDRITKPQRRAMKTNPFGDWDGDRVINGLDCQPRNKRKHMVKVYHGTQRINLGGIKNKGIYPSRITNRNSDDDEYNGYSYWSDDMNQAKSYGGLVVSTDLPPKQYREGQRISKERQPYEELRVPGEVLVKDRIPPEKIKIENPTKEDYRYEKQFKQYHEDEE